MTTHTRASTAGEISQHLGAMVVGDRAAPVARLETFDKAGAGCLTFIREARFAKRWRDSAGACALISADIVALAAPEGAAPQPGRALIVVPDADLALVKVLVLFAPKMPPHPPGVHPTAIVAQSARISASASIGAYCVVGEGAEVGERTVVMAHAFIGHGATIGSDTYVNPGAKVLDRCVVGNHCILHSGCVLGADGFGFRPAPDGKGLVKVPHIGNVVVHNHVEIGANSCVDRGKFASTVIGEGTKIDNLVQIAHNCTVGRSCVICGGTMLAGSSSLGDGVVLAGGVGVADGIKVGAGSRVGAHSGVNHDVPPGSEYLGFPAGPATEWRRTYAKMRLMGRKDAPRQGQP